MKSTQIAGLNEASKLRVLKDNKARRARQMKSAPSWCILWLALEASTRVYGLLSKRFVSSNSNLVCNRNCQNCFFWQLAGKTALPMAAN